MIMMAKRVKKTLFKQTISEEEQTVRANCKLVRHSPSGRTFLQCDFEGSEDAMEEMLLNFSRSWRDTEDMEGDFGGGFSSNLEEMPASKPREGGETGKIPPMSEEEYEKMLEERKWDEYEQLERDAEEEKAWDEWRAKQRIREYEKEGFD